MCVCVIGGERERELLNYNVLPTAQGRLVTGEGRGWGEGRGAERLRQREVLDRNSGHNGA